LPLADQTATVGQNVTFNVASCCDVVTYTWFKDNTTQLSSTSSSLVLNSVHFSDRGVYTVSVRDSGGTTNSSATLTVHPANQQVIFPQIPDQDLGPNLVPLNASVVFGLPINYKVAGPAVLVQSPGTTSLRLTGAGTVTVDAFNVGGDDFNPIDVAQSFHVRAIQQYGSLGVTLGPSEAIATGAKWQVDGGLWFNSGDSVTLTVGNHTVHFNTIANWVSPGDQVAGITAGRTTTLVGTYQPQPVINPPQPVINDFNGDGSPDLVFEDSQGNIALWSMDVQTLTSSRLFNPSKVSDPGWRVVGVGDFDGDHKPDLLFEHSEGTLVAWLMNGTTLVSATFLDPNGTGSKDWRVVATGDFNRDGQTDILFQHTDGTLAFWYMRGIHLVQSVILNPTRPNDVRWRAIGVGDFNTDGHLDILFQHEDGTLAVWYMNEATLVSSANLNPSFPGDVNWRAVAVTDLHRDGAPDILFQHRRTTELAVWVLDKINLISGMLLSPSKAGGTWQLVAP
jgi:hypothetical protein